MSDLSTLSKGENHTAISAGELNNIGNFTFTHDALPVDVEGKVFISQALGMTGGILSLNKLPPNTSMPFHHTHIEHEEVYIILDGHAEFRVDDQRFEAKTGSVVRIAPQGVRCWRNLSDTPLYYATFQVKMGKSVNTNTIEDGRGVNLPVEW
ncbi:cupin domain-containing protein [Enterovibrio nigricans]|uniref:Cupin domain-containing protein n=1 Tax=Enterovibrio nigricans DSM 22720 TaxID=1121868 RepID=A0A1T4UM47_9GAMM|nr:cupin domain-containing protein [Enterovibrio nigricans]PKF49489.1 cupin domain-containing protein [Enterovibrio nigricans]SKA53767.1 Cupin domain-containing protein [Enterovibrio nigricans DSM 22720]